MEMQYKCSGSRRVVEDRRDKKMDTLQRKFWVRYTSSVTQSVLIRGIRWTVRP
jgi:hypothetical protein